MINLEERNKKIIDAVISKANAVCPGSLALIGINGSFMTGDYYEKSDLDLLILINDDRGWQLGCSMIQDDLQVGHDIYCTRWEDLQYDANYEHPNISKLMDSEIVYCADEKYKERLLALRQKAKDILKAPFSGEDYEKAEKGLKEAEHCYAIAMLNKQYFHYGVKRVYEELGAMKKRPEKLCDMIEHVVSAVSAVSVKEHLTILMKETAAVFHQVKEKISAEKKPVAADTIGGTYEEMYSNWRNKMYLAASTGNRHLAFMSLISANVMFAEISSQVEIDEYDVLGCYNPEDLQQTAHAYDHILHTYLGEYKKGSISERRYSDIDAFVTDYLMKRQ